MEEGNRNGKTRRNKKKKYTKKKQAVIYFILFNFLVFFCTSNKIK
jgi:hypothetical protein